MLNNLIINGNNETLSYCVKRYLKDTKGKSYRTLFSEIYAYMSNEYRNEYFYKNTLLNELILQKHCLNTTIALSELPVNKSKADFVMINGKGIVYEIKTELDNIERLNNQIEDYYRAFSYVNVVTCMNHLDKIKKSIDENVGIIILTENNKLETVKEAKEKRDNLSHKTIFKILRKAEFESIILEAGYDLPNMSEFIYYTECLKIIECLDINYVQKEMIKRLKNRCIIEIEEFKNTVPYEFKSLVYFSSFRKKEYLALEKVLSYKYRGV